MKLTEVQANEIAEKFRGITTVQSIAKEYGVSRTTVYKIAKRFATEIEKPPITPSTSTGA